MKLIFNLTTPKITFNGKLRFKGKASLIKLIKDSSINLNMGAYNFEGDCFNAVEALSLIAGVIK